jgi:hypothetical protein
MNTPPRRSSQGTVDANGAVRCHYAADPAARPHCTLTATIRLGTVPLCPSCMAGRSSLGKGQTSVTLPAGPVIDVLDWIGTAQQQAATAERNLAAAVTRARQNGHPWSVIGARLGITRQAAQQRFTMATTRASAHEATKNPTRAS